MVIAFLVAALAASYADASTKLPRPLPQPVQRINSYGFSFQPPDDPGWTVIGQAPYTIALARRGNSADESIAIEAGVLKLADIKSADGLEAAWKTRENQNTDPERFTTVTHDVTAAQFQGADCVRSHMLVQDHSPNTASHSHRMMLLESLALACPHPGSPRTAIYVSYSERYYPDKGDTQFAEVANTIFKSVEFTPLPLSAASDKVLPHKQVVYKISAGQTLPLDLLGGDRGDWSRRILCTLDASCTLFGYTSGGFSGSTELLITRLGQKRNAQWAKTISGGYSDQLWYAINAQDGGFLTVGASESRFPSSLKIYSPHHRERPIFIRLNSDGQIAWAGSVQLSSDISSAEIGYATPTQDGGYVLAGSYSEAFPQSGVQPLPGVWSSAAPGKKRGREYTYPILLRMV